MNGRAARVARKAANEAARQTGNVAGAVVNKVLEYARGIELRTEALENEVSNIWPATHANTALRDRNFMGRLRWLFCGR